MEIKAELRHTSIGTFKAGLVARLVRGKNINEALKLLSFTEKKAARLMKSLLQTAVSNALDKQVVDIDNLYVKSLIVNQAPPLKRFQPRAQGRASLIRKRRSHISLILDEKKK